MEIANCTKKDFDQILNEFSEFWDSDRTLALHHPTLINEFGNSAFAVKQDDKVIAYLFGFISQTAPIGYVHLLAVRQGYRQQRLGRRLYAHFTKYVRTKGCRQLKAITSPANLLSIAFHKSIGMKLLGDSYAGDIPVVKDYSGQGKDRVVLMKDID